MALYLLEVSLINGTESQALYTAPRQGAEPFANETEVTAMIETKLGQAMDNAEHQLEFLVGFDHTGKTFCTKTYADKHEEEQSVVEDGEEKTITVVVPYAITSNRLITVSAKEDADDDNKVKETAEMNKYNTAKEAEAKYHKKRGAAMAKDSGYHALLTMITNGSSVGMNEYWVWTPPVVEPEESVEEPEESVEE